MKKKLAYQNFEQTLQLLLKKAKKGSLSVQTVLIALHGRGKMLLLIFLSLGFAQIPGIAIVLGLFISYMGLRIAWGKNVIWMPKFLHQKKIASFFLTTVIKQTLWILKFVKRWSRARYAWITKKKATRVLNGCIISLVGLGLATSPPVPLTGMLASVAVFLISIGLLNDDGLYTLLGYVAALFYLATVLLLLNYFSFTEIYRWFKNLLFMSLSLTT